MPEVGSAMECEARKRRCLAAWGKQQLPTYRPVETRKLNERKSRSRASARQNMTRRPRIRRPVACCGAAVKEVRLATAEPVDRRPRRPAPPVPSSSSSAPRQCRLFIRKLCVLGVVLLELTDRIVRK